MAFIRRVRMKSGATAVQVAECCAGRQRIVKQFGSARRAVELGVRIERAEERPTGLPQMMGTRDPRKAVLTREDGRERPNEACYYASL